MPPRIIDFDALWTSDKLAACKESVRAEYAWFYGLADAFGCFEINLTSIHSRLACIRPKLYRARIAAILEEFERNGLLFTWNGSKKYGFWCGSDKKGRLPPETTRERYRRSTPPVPLEALAEYESRFRRDAAGNCRTGLGVGFGLGIGKGLERGRMRGAHAGFGVEGGVEGEGAEKISEVVENPERENQPLPLRTNENKTFNPACPKCGEEFSSNLEIEAHYQHCNGKRGKKFAAGGAA